jgi:enoyl-CoA hydratase/carnithine racemase
MGKNKALQALLTGVDFSAEQAVALNIITQYVPKADMDNVMNKEIVATSIKDENAGADR